MSVYKLIATGSTFGLIECWYLDLAVALNCVQECLHAGANVALYGPAGERLR